MERQVGAAYLLAMLTNTPLRGLPGTVIDRVQFQRTAVGHPLDDVIVRTHDNRGQPAVLEIQVKRSLTAAPSDPEFAAGWIQTEAKKDDLVWRPTGSTTFLRDAANVCWSPLDAEAFLSGLVNYWNNWQ